MEMMNMTVEKRDNDDVIEGVDEVGEQPSI
jgi:hypothetical protein